MSVGYAREVDEQGNGGLAVRKFDVGVGRNAATGKIHTTIVKSISATPANGYSPDYGKLGLGPDLMKKAHPIWVVLSIGIIILINAPILYLYPEWPMAPVLISFLLILAILISPEHNLLFLFKGARRAVISGLLILMGPLHVLWMAVEPLELAIITALFFSSFAMLLSALICRFLSDLFDLRLRQ